MGEATERPWQYGLLDTDTGSWLKLHKHGDMPVILKGKKTIAVFVGDNAAADARLSREAANAHDDLVKALRDIVKAEGAFSRDQLTHAGSVIDAMKTTAIAALAKAEVK